jgi:hypothetical protein
VIEVTVTDEFKALIEGKKLEFLALKDDNTAFIKIGDRAIYKASFDASQNIIGAGLECIHQAEENQIVLPLVEGGIFNLAPDASESQTFYLNMDSEEYNVNSVASF